MEDHGGRAAVGGGWVVVTQTLTKHQSTPAGRERGFHRGSTHIIKMQ